MPYPKRYKDLAGQTFGRLHVIEFAGLNKHRMALWRCQCECGKLTTVLRANLERGSTRSCGCLVMEQRIKHGHKRHVFGQNYQGTATYNAWSSMKHRCFNPSNTHYDIYGGRGITVCEEWCNNFAAFLRDMGERPAGMSLERVDNNGNYCKANCIWIPRSEQAANKQNTKRLTINGVTKRLIEWAREAQMPVNRLRVRVQRGWPVEELFDPPRY